MRVYETDHCNKIYSWAYVPMWLNNILMANITTIGIAGVSEMRVVVSKML